MELVAADTGTISRKAQPSIIRLQSLSSFSISCVIHRQHMRNPNTAEPLTRWKQRSATLFVVVSFLGTTDLRTNSWPPVCASSQSHIECSQAQPHGSPTPFDGHLTLQLHTKFDKECFAASRSSTTMRTLSIHLSVLSFLPHLTGDARTCAGV